MSQENQTSEMLSRGENVLAIVGGTIIDASGRSPIIDGVVLIKGDRLHAVGSRELVIPENVEQLTAHGKYIIPGLMDANVHLLGDIRLENLLRYYGRWRELVVEAAQMALKAGLTTVFDTWGPRTHLMEVRDSIERGEVVGSRIFCAGNIIGLDGPFSLDFSAKAAEVASKEIVELINAQWVENVGPGLTWYTPERVAEEVRTYISQGINFVKYASSEHRWGDPTTSLIFSTRTQAAIVKEAHRAHITAQAHASSVESLKAAIDAGCDIVQHCNITGPTPIPGETLDALANRRTGAVVFPFTQRRFEWIMKECPVDRVYFSTSDDNCKNLIKAQAMLMLASDACVLAPEIASDPALGRSWLAPGDDNLAELGQGHFHWLRAMEEKGLPAIDGLRAATHNIAVAYGMERDFGTIEEGKLADLLILEKDPLKSAENYRSIATIIKGGRIVEHRNLPTHPILSRREKDPAALKLLSRYRPHRHF